MKFTVILLLLISVLFFTISNHQYSFCSAARAPAEIPVYDINGDRIRVDQPYAILPPDGRTDRGFNMDLTGNKTCPFDVVQSQTFYSIPLQLYPVNSKKGDIIRISTDLNIFFWSTYTSCLPEYSNYWKVDKYDPSTNEYFITTGGEKGNPGPETISNWFKVEKSGDKRYKFVYCPSVCKTCKVLCKDVGIFVQDGKRRAALSDVPFEFSFKKFTGF